MGAPRFVIHLRTMTNRRPSGFTLLELLVVLALITVLAAMGFPATARARDGMAVVAARDAVAGEIARARALATLHGSARVRIESTGIAIEAPAAVPFAVRSLADLRVALSIDGAGHAEIDFDALGLGRLANRTVRIARGEAVAGLTLSSYGRVRKW